MDIIKVKPDVLVCKSDICLFDSSTINSLKLIAEHSPKKRARLCAHHFDDDLLHEMLIVLHKDTYIQPHKHFNKTESFHVVEGSAEVLLFDVNGLIKKRIKLAAKSKDTPFFYRLNADTHHTVLVKSQYFVFVETTNGPFRMDATEYANWAPPSDAMPDRIKKYQESLN